MAEVSENNNNIDLNNNSDLYDGDTQPVVKDDVNGSRKDEPEKSEPRDTAEAVSPGAKADFMRRIREVKATRWVRFGIVAVIFTLWVAWVGNWWLWLFIFLLFDIYITGYIPLTKWKNSKSAIVRSVMSWVDAIIYALVLVYFIFAFIGQNYMIPSSSLEKTLLTGDYLWVNKMTYGPRVPMTPVHFPLVHNKLPVINTKSYLEWPTNDYHRLKGLRDVETFDIVVFNFPAGDTVALKSEEPGNMMVGGRYYDQLVSEYGWERVNADKATFGDIVYRPVDRRENYVKRAVGLPGQKIRIKSDTIYIDGVAQPLPENVQFNYILALNAPLTEDIAHELDITIKDVQPVPPGDNYVNFIEYMDVPEGSQLYFVPLTSGMIKTLSDKGMLVKAEKYNDMPVVNFTKGEMYPLNAEVSKDWTVSDWGGKNGVMIPKKGLTIKNFNSTAWQLYNRCIRNYEGHADAHFTDGKLYIDGKPTDTYTFAMDYYFMMGDNRDNSLDSRFWGFVPEDHIVGTPVFVIASFDQERSLFNGALRTDRLFIDANPDK